MIVSYSMAAGRSGRSCLRRRWWVFSIQVTIALQRSSRVRHRKRFSTFFGSSAKKDSIAALSPPYPANRLFGGVIAE